mmetsp:Transcript_41945/g.110831  ORF Transcript_41945/g.110831 Transcript_41945/m.110831 type:complete len:148 (-) Transcript_41945:111-554(-)
MPPPRRGGPCAADVGLLPAPSVRPPSSLSDAHVLEVINRCYKHQKAFIRCSAGWKEWQLDTWDCGACEWNIYVCAASILCPSEAQQLAAECPAPADKSPSPAAAAAGTDGRCHGRWDDMRRCLGRVGLHLRWNGERECRTSVGLMGV